MPNSAPGPLVSVVIPTYGRPESLLDAIESVETQSYPATELVVVDDCSPTLVAESIGSVPREID